MSLMIGGVGRRGTPLLLDLLPPAAVAYSMRKLRTAYAGACILVRRASDDAETDIGFGSDGWLDTPALAAFCAGTSGYVGTIYDQTANGRHANQNDPSKQPRIVNAGTIEVTVAGDPVMVAASPSRLTAAPFTHGSAEFTTSCVGLTNTFAYGRFVSLGNVDFNSPLRVAAILANSGSNSVLSFRDFAALAPASVVSGQLHAIHTRYATGDVVATRVDGAAEVTGTYATVPLDSPISLSIFADAADAGPLSGKIGEVVHWTSSLDSTNRTILWSNQSAGWSL